MALTKKDFVAHAKLLRSVRSDSVRNRLTDEQVKLFKKSSPQFDVKKFRDAVNK